MDVLFEGVPALHIHVQINIECHGIHFFAVIAVVLYGIVGLVICCITVRFQWLVWYLRLACIMLPNTNQYYLLFSHTYHIAFRHFSIFYIIIYICNLLSILICVWFSEMNVWHRLLFCDFCRSVCLAFFIVWIYTGDCSLYFFSR